MNDHDDAFLDDVAVLALGALPPDEAQRVAAHVRNCRQCRELYSQLRPAADRVGYGAEDSADGDALAAARLKKRIMASVGEAMGAPSSVVQRTARGRTYVLPWAAAAAAILIAAGLGVQNSGLRHDYNRAQAAARQAAARQTALAAQLREQHARTAHLARQTATQKTALAGRLHAQRVAQRTSTEQAIVAANMFPLLEPDAKRYAVSHGVVIARGGKLFLALHDLAQPPAHKVYQTWTLAIGAKTMTPGATFRPNADGIALIELHAASGDTAAVAMTMEPVGGSRAPTTKPTFLRKLS